MIVPVIVGRYKRNLELIEDGSRWIVKFRYNKRLVEEVRNMKGARWNPEKRHWTIERCARNQFQLDYLSGKNPYAPYDDECPDLDYPSHRPLREHQMDFLKHMKHRSQCIIAGEMGTGKTLAAIELMERVCRDSNDAWYVGPRSGIEAVGNELTKWESRIFPRMLTYEKLVNVVKNWDEHSIVPRVVIFDESSKIKTHTAIRSQAAMHVADTIREVYDRGGYVILMSGTPAPKSPLDWWHQCEVACPGFLREGDPNKMRRNMCLLEMRPNPVTGGEYPHLITWFDDENKCAICGDLPENHKEKDHPWEASVNEVERLYKRMKGLVYVKFKKDCLDLPEKQYQIINIKPPIEVLKVAKMIPRKARRGAQALMLLRELSDGFQYVEVPSGEQVKCQYCNGLGKVPEMVYPEDYDPTGPQHLETFPQATERMVDCEVCDGEGKVDGFVRKADELPVPTPKDQAFLDQLDLHEDVGRFIVWGGFTGTIDRLVRMAHQQGWATLRVDGRGFIGENEYGQSVDYKELLAAMDGSHPRRQELLDLYPQLCFVGHPDAGGMALTLTSSPTELFFSNSFKGESRMQAEDRGHRLGMDENRGLTIIDLLYLPTDRVVLDNLKAKKKLQLISLGELSDAFDRTGVQETVR